MDLRIQAFKSTTFFGKRSALRTIAHIQVAARLLPKNSRQELARTICDHLDCHLPGGGY